MPTIDAIRKSFSSSFPDHFPVLLEIKFVEFSIMLLLDIDLVLTVQYLKPEWGKGAIGQDGQVTILIFQMHMAYHIWKFLASNPALHSIL